jgi:hypothetical protein
MKVERVDGAAREGAMPDEPFPSGQPAAESPEKCGGSEAATLGSARSEGKRVPSSLKEPAGLEGTSDCDIHSDHDVQGY